MELSTSAGLTREEQCMLKTALAFVVIKSRNNKRKNTVENDDTAVALAASQEKEGEENATSGGAASKGIEVSCTASTLDRLFDSSPPTSQPLKETEQQDNDQQQQNSAAATPQITPKTNNNHRHSHFLQSTSDKRHLDNIFHAACRLARTVSNDCSSNHQKTALFGAAGHLANQLQLLLIVCDNNKQSLTTPAKKKKRNATDVSSPKDDDASKEKASIAFVQEWIRGSLLEVLTSRNIDEESDGNNDIQEDIQELLAAFHVFQVMVPQLVNLSPKLIGHIFQATTKILRDLYDDGIVVATRTKKCLLDHLATSTLRLMETCWMSKLPAAAANNNSINNHHTQQRRHQQFMTEELQFRLGDLMVPIPFAQIPHAYKHVCDQQALQQHHKRMLARVQQSRMNGGGIKMMTMTPTHTKQRTENTTAPSHTLGPGAKLIIRMAIYRLFIMQG